MLKTFGKKIKALFIDLEILEPLLASEFLLEFFQVVLDYMELINVRILIVLLLLIALPVTIIAVRQEQTTQQHAGLSTDYNNVVLYTQEIRSLNKKFQETHTGTIENQLKAAVLLREQSMLSLMQTQPGQAITLTINGEERASYPEELQNHIEITLTISGNFSTTMKEVNGKIMYEYYLQTQEGTIRLHFPTPPGWMIQNKIVQVRGVKLGDSMALPGIENLK